MAEPREVVELRRTVLARNRELAEVQAERDALAAQLADLREQWINHRDDVKSRHRNRADRAEASLAKVRELHQPVSAREQFCMACSQEEKQPDPVGWWVPWPCPTIRALPEAYHAMPADVPSGVPVGLERAPDAPTQVSTSPNPSEEQQ